MDYEDYEAYAAVYEDDQYSDYSEYETDSKYDIDKDIEDMLAYDPDLYDDDFKRIFGDTE